MNNSMNRVINLKEKSEIICKKYIKRRLQLIHIYKLYVILIMFCKLRISGAIYFRVFKKKIKKIGETETVNK